jgi:hypothetical protein
MTARLIAIADALKGNPLALALVVINLAFVAVGVFALREISAAVERKDARLAELMKDCFAREHRP